MSGRVAAIVRAGADLGPLRRLEGVDRTLVFGMAGTVLLNVAQTVLTFGVTLALSRMLGADGFGAYAYAFAWSSLLAVPSVLGITPLIVRNVSAYRQREQWGLLRGMLARANHAVLISSGVLVSGGAIVALIVNGSKHELLWPLLVALPLVPIVALTSIRQAAMQGLGRVVLGRMPETLVAPALFLVLLGLAYALSGSDLSATWAVALQVASLLVTLTAGALLLRRVLPEHAKTEPAQHALREWIRSAMPLLVFSGVQALNAQIDIILLGAIKGSTDAGLFSVASRVSGLVTFLLLAATYPLSPVIARLHAAGETPLLRRTVRRSALGIFVVSVPVAIGVVALARPLLAIFGGEFKGGVEALILLSVAQLIYTATGLAGTVLVMTGHESSLVRGVAVGAITSVVLNAILIPPYGLNGAAIASLVGTAVMNLSLVYYARRRSQIASSAFGV